MGCPDAGQQSEQAVKPDKGKEVKPAGGGTKPAPYSFAFGVESHKAQFREGATYTDAVVETNKPTGDTRDITYTSSDPAIATVDNSGQVTFVSPGTVTITATKAAEAGLPKATASYILHLSNFAFEKASHKAQFRKGGTHTSAVIEKNKAPGDTRDITYTSSDPAIATVDSTGQVTFVSQGTVTITATKAAEAGLPKAAASYILYLTMKPMDREALMAEIKRAMDTHGNTVDLNYIDTTAITIMAYIFSDDSTYGKGLHKFNGDISKWDVSKVTVMTAMFNGATSFNQDISEWKVGKVTVMSNMFDRATSFNQDISEWKVGKVTVMNSMFNGATSFNQDISDWDVSLVTDMSGMFQGATSFNQDISEWKVGKVTNMRFMFNGATSFNQDISEWKVGKVTDMESMFQGATSFNQDISEWKVGKVTDMESMFQGATSFNQDISDWDVSLVTDMTQMFQGATRFTQNLDAWRTRINAAIKASGWGKADRMFTYSGIRTLPAWCRDVPACRKANPGIATPRGK